LGNPCVPGETKRGCNSPSPHQDSNKSAWLALLDKGKFMSENSALNLLNEVIEIYSRLHPIGNRTTRDAAFQPVKYRLNHLRQIVELDYPGVSQYVDKLGKTKGDVLD
jgi:hypothetical protein